MDNYYFPNLTTWIKILIADCIQCQTNKVFANTRAKSKQEQLAPTKTYFNEMIMIDTKGTYRSLAGTYRSLADAISNKSKMSNQLTFSTPLTNS